uniref:hypothetical protein n=1 Tax=Amycolatopsis sp. CA-290885 TaxID=3239925 RepID=UPI003F490DB4
MDRIQVTEQLEQTFHIDGPHDRESVLAAAGGLAHLVRYLNHATLPGDRADRTLEWANTTHATLGYLAAAAYASEQLIGQLAVALDRSAEDPTLYDDRRGDTSATATARESAARVERAAGIAGQLGARLTHAMETTVHLGND